jgi:hypothetical protein
MRIKKGNTKKKNQGKKKESRILNTGQTRVDFFPPANKCVVKIYLFRVNI